MLKIMFVYIKIQRSMRLVAPRRALGENTKESEKDIVV